MSHRPDYRIHSEIRTNSTRKAKLRPPSNWDISCQASEAAGPEQAPRAKEIREVLWEQVWNVPSTLKCLFHKDRFLQHSPDGSKTHKFTQVRAVYRQILQCSVCNLQQGKTIHGVAVLMLSCLCSLIFVSKMASQQKVLDNWQIKRRQLTVTHSSRSILSNLGQF